MDHFITYLYQLFGSGTSCFAILVAQRTTSGPFLVKIYIFNHEDDARCNFKCVVHDQYDILHNTKKMEVGTSILFFGRLSGALDVI